MTCFLPKCWDWKTLGFTKQSKTLPHEFDKPAALGITRKCGRLCTNWFCIEINILLSGLYK
jgi:hypothetical protein